MAKKRLVFVREVGCLKAGNDKNIKFTSEEEP